MTAQDDLGQKKAAPAGKTQGRSKKATTGKQQSLMGIPGQSAGKNEHQKFIDWFHEAFYARHGAYPTWDGPAVKAVQQLLRAHGFEVVQARATRMLQDPPAWMAKGGGALGIRCLRANFDALAGDVRPLTAAEYYYQLGQKRRDGAPEPLLLPTDSSSSEAAAASLEQWAKLGWVSGGGR